VRVGLADGPDNGFMLGSILEMVVGSDADEELDNLEVGMVEALVIEFRDDVNVGFELVTKEGNEVGSCEGLTVGVNDTTGVGDTVRFTLGFEEGEESGSLDGLAVGAMEVTEVGFTLVM